MAMAQKCSPSSVASPTWSVNSKGSTVTVSLAAYTDLLHEAQARLCKIDARREQAERATTAPPPANTQKVMDFPHRHSTVALT